MTPAEARDRANRLLSAVPLKLDEQEHRWWANEISRELLRVAAECGWHKETVRKMENELEEARTILNRISINGSPSATKWLKEHETKKWPNPDPKEIL